jgi:hypothetical protein
MTATRRYLMQCQSSDAANLATGASVATTLKARANARMSLVYHPTDAQGVSAAWAGDVLTDLAGQVSWVARIMTGGLTGNVLTASQAAALRGNEVSYLERFAARSQNIMNGGYCMAGIPIDIMRIVDNFASNVESAGMDLLTTNRILPYTDDGISIWHAVVNAEFERLVTQGAAVGGTLILSKPRISSANDSDRARGIMPALVGSFRIQAGTYKLQANIKVAQ